LFNQFQFTNFDSFSTQVPMGLTKALMLARAVGQIPLGKGCGDS